ncbi:MAG: pyruvate formate-lyase-activating protein [Rikenellaceae bacterium]
MKIHSLESFGTVDGPGIRFVAFLQGCPLRCLYCHNPDTWSGDSADAKVMSAQELFAEVCKYNNFIKTGGVTLSGGEPLLQASEAAELFELCRKEGIHTALDTAGVLWSDDVERLLKSTDLVLLDIKSIDEKQFEEITVTGKLKRTLEFLDKLQERGIKTWIRHVVVPGYTDNDELLAKLSKFVAGYSVVEKVEILPYHDLGVQKYVAMGLDYPLEGIEPLAKSRAEEIRTMFDR